jgi:hypothetical protein
VSTASIDSTRTIRGQRKTASCPPDRTSGAGKTQTSQNFPEQAAHPGVAYWKVVRKFLADSIDGHKMAVAEATGTPERA